MGAFALLVSSGYPKEAHHIITARRIHRLQVLQGAFCRPIVKDGTPIGGFIWHYANGSQRETEIIYGQDVRDWWYGNVRERRPWRSARNPPSESDRGRVVWTGNNPVARKAGVSLRLYLTAYENLQPDLEVTSIDLVSKMTTAAPFLVTLTVEP